MNGDSWCDFDPAALLDFHARVGALATIATVAAAERVDGGFVELDARGAVAGFSEKAALARSGVLSTGVYALESRFWNDIPPSRSCSLEEEVFPALVGHGLFGWPAPAVLYDIGTPERLDAFRRAFAGDY